VSTGHARARSTSETFRSLFQIGTEGGFAEQQPAFPSNPRRPIDLHPRRVPQESPLLADKVPVSHLARCTTAGAAEAESPRPAERRSDGIHSDPRHGARAPRRTGDGSAGAPIRGTSKEGTLGGDGDYVTPEDSEPAEAKCLRMRARMDDGVSADGLLERSAQTPTAAGPGHERGVEGGCSRLAPPCGERRDQVTRYSTHMARRRRDSPPTSRPRLGRQTESWRAVRERMGSPGHLAPPSLPLQSTRVRLRSPAQDPWRGIRESLPREADRDCLEDRTDA
jgi:hypothetical protein